MTTCGLRTQWALRPGRCAGFHLQSTAKPLLTTCPYFEASLWWSLMVWGIKTSSTTAGRQPLGLDLAFFW
jgi:hypothetical protein